MRIFTKSFLSIAVILLSLSLAYNSQAQQVTSSWDISPPPINGAYEPGQVIHVCFTLSYFLNGGGNNWLHGIVIDFPPGWDLSTITNTSVPPTSPGIWVWMPNGVTGSNNLGLSWGPGFYYDANSGGGTIDGNPGDNWGVSASSLPANYTFCFDIMTSEDCGGDGNPYDEDIITPRIQITGDAESGSWNGPLPPEAGSSSLNEVELSCCEANSGTPPDDDVLICENGLFDLIELLTDTIDEGGEWSGPEDWIDVSDTLALGTFNPLTDPAGEYTYSVTYIDTLLSDTCVSETIINMVYNDLGHIGTLTYCEDYSSNITSIVTGSAAVNITVPSGGTWHNPAGDPIPSGILNPLTDSPGLYTYRYYDSNNCKSSFEVLIHFASGGAAGFPNTVDHCSSDGCFQPFYGLGGSPVIGGGWFIYKEAGGYLFNAPTWDACINLETFANTHNYYGDLKFVYMLDAYPCPPGEVPVTVNVHWPADTGESSSVSLCESDPEVDLITYLGGTPEPGHEWTNEVGVVISNMLTPSDYLPNTTQNFFYTGGFEGTSCYSGAYVQITFLPENAYAGEDNTINRCQADPSIYMNDEIPDDGTQVVQAGGTWQNAAGETYGSYFIPGDNDAGTYVFTYNVNSSCDNDQSILTIILEPSFSAGTSGILDICDNETDIPLSDGLTGIVDPGGTWTLAGANVAATVDGSSVTDGAVYTYTTGAPPCVQSSTVTINRMIAPSAGVLTNVAQNYCDSDAEFDLMSLFTTNPSVMPTSDLAGWTGPTGEVESINPADGSSVSGTYAYTIQNSGCGTVFVTIDITVGDTPNAGIDGALTVCANEPGIINLINSLGTGAATGGTWTDPDGSDFSGGFDPDNNDPAGVYTYTVGTNCTDDATVTVSYETLPDPGTSTIISTCSGDPSFNLIDQMGTGATQGTWTLDGATVGNIFYPATSTPGVYTNTVTAGSCPDVTATLEILVTPVSDSGIDATVSFCETQGNVDLTSYLGGTPQYTGGSWEDEAGNPVANPFDVGSLTCGPTTYEYTYNVGSGDCSASSTLTFDVVCVPEAGQDGSIELCSSDDPFSLFDILTGTYSTTGTWTTSLNATVADPENMNPSTMGTGDTYTYTVDGLADTPCIAASADVVVSITPAMASTNEDASCTASYLDYILSFEITGGLPPYAIVGGSNPGTITGTTFTSSEITSGTDYEVIISDASGCSDLTVSGTSPPCICPASASFTSSDAAICIGDSTDLVFNLTGGTPGDYTFEYTDGMGSPNTVTDASNGQTISVNPTATTTYTLTSVSNGTCDGTASGSVTITVDELNDAGNDVILDPLCADGTTLVLESALGEPTDGTFFPSSITLTAANSGDYNYTVSGGQCPDDVAIYTINILELVATEVAICEPNQTEYTVEIEVSGGVEPYFVDGVQLTGTTFISPIIPMGEDYNFDITDSSTCDAEVNITGVSPGCFCAATGSLSGSTTLCLGESTNIVVNLSGDAPFNIMYTSSNPSAPPTTLNGIYNGHLIAIDNPLTTTTYTITQIRDAYCYGETMGSPVTITVNTPIETTPATEICSNTAETYQVQFDYSGGVAPFSFGLPNTSNEAGVYLSGPINSGEGYNISVNDAGVCAGHSVSSTGHTCDCISDAGSISSAPLVVCFDETVSLSTGGNETLDGNDALQYILHDGDNNAIGNIIGTSSDGEFTFDYTNMLAGTVYYINAVVGNTLSNGNMNLSDICLSLSNGIEVVMNEYTSATLSGGGIVCPGVPVDLTITPTGVGPWDFEYAVDGVTQPMITTTGPYILPVTQPAEYTLVSVSDNNCQGVVSGTAVVENHEIPTASLSSEPTVCENSGDGPEIVLTGNGPLWTFIYSIDGVEQTPITTMSSNYTIPAEVDGTYALVSVESNGCDGSVSGSQHITILTAPTASISGESSVCEGDFGTFELDLSGTGPWNVEYTVGGILQDPLIGINDGYEFDSSVGGDYVLVSVNDANCSGETLSSEASLTVNPLPTATITASKNAVCAGETVTLGINLDGVPPFDVTYVLNGDTMTATGLYSNFVQTLTPVDPINFEVIYVSDGSNPTCSAYPYEFVYIDALVLPNPPVLTNDTICAYNGPVKIGVSPAPNLTYSWSPETHLSDPTSSRTTFQPTLTGPYAKDFEYVLTATNGLCSASDTMTLTVDPGPKARFDYSPDPVLSEDPTVFFINKTVGRKNLNYFWEIDSLHTSHEFEPSYRFPDGVNDVYDITLTAIDPLTGCFNMHTRRLEVKPQMISYVPNAFTPDGDGTNDLWGPVLSNVDTDDYKLTVYNRLGEVVFTSKDVKQKWNGSFMNDSYFVEPGVYIWIIETKNLISLDEVTMKGTVTVVR